MQPWNDEGGDWQGLSAPTQVPRYRAIADLVARLASPAASVLDVGCGQALLQPYLPDGCRYMGLEPSAAAVQTAQTSVIHSTAETFAAEGRKWDVIIFNEMLYYTQQPAALLRRYAGHLLDGGWFIISIYQRPESARERAWRLLGVRKNRNRSCTLLVGRLARLQRWNVAAEMTVPIPGTTRHWRIWAAQPGRS